MSQQKPLWSSLQMPPGSRGPGLVFDRRRQTLVFHGGSGFHTTWETRGAGWVPVTETGPATFEQFSAMAYDSKHGLPLLVEGPRDSSRPIATWSWNGEMWERLHAAGPPTISGMVMAYDEDRQRLVLYGRDQSAPESGRYGTWTLVDDAWRCLDDGQQGPQESYGAMAYDAGRFETLLFGTKYTLEGSRVTALWVWDWSANRWTELTASLPVEEKPPFRFAASLGYDVARQRTVLFGGKGHAGYLPETWEWDGSHWSLLSETGPPPRRDAAMVYDPSHRGLILCGGWSEEHGLFDGSWLLAGEAVGAMPETKTEAVGAAR